jgi:hypothetical protein
MMCLGKRLCYVQRGVDGVPQGEVMSFLGRDDVVLRKEMVILPLKWGG